MPYQLYDLDYCYEPIYGAIPIYPHEKSIMSLPFMQKLHRIRQMGLISLVFLGANHTRLEHSVGTMHLAGKMIARVMRNPDLRSKVYVKMFLKKRISNAFLIL
ncbi:MAG: hypothetical protein H3Z54_10105 [archaeon]|nr:hypothetical protein [archaeon]